MTPDRTAPSQEDASEVEVPEQTAQALADSLNPDHEADGTPPETTSEVEQKVEPKVEPALATVIAERDALKESERVAQQAAADARNKLAQAALTAQTERREAEERAARVKDAADVESGDITASDALKRADARQAAATEADTTATEKANTERLLAQVFGEQGVVARAGRLDAALEYAETHGIDYKVLLNDASLTTEAAMELKAKELALEKKEQDAEGTETYDQAQSGAVTRNVDDMSAIEKVNYGLTHPPRTRR